MEMCTHDKDKETVGKEREWIEVDLGKGVDEDRDREGPKIRKKGQGE